jgi:hypothetical protein
MRSPQTIAEGAGGDKAKDLDTPYTSFLSRRIFSPDSFTFLSSRRSSFSS